MRLDLLPTPPETKKAQPLRAALLGTASEGGSSAAILFHFLRKQLLHLRLAEEVTDEDHERRTATESG